MKKLIAFICLLCFCLSGCVGSSLSQDQITGVWQSKNFDESIRNDQVGMEVYITDDGYLYILQSTSTTAGIMTYANPYRYEMKDKTLVYTALELDWKLPEFPVTGETNITIKKDTVQLQINGQRYPLEKISDTVPYGYTDADMKEIEENNQRTQQEILSFADHLNEIWDISLTETEDTVFYGADGVDHGIQFKAGDIGICITTQDVASDYSGDTYVTISGGEMQLQLPCIIADNFVIVYDEDNPLPGEWLDALSMLSAE